jgi:hypothetical protein
MYGVTSVYLKWAVSHNTCIAGTDKQNFSVTTATFFINLLPGLYLHNRGGHNAARTTRSRNDIYVVDTHTRLTLNGILKYFLKSGESYLT